MDGDLKILPYSGRHRPQRCRQTDQTAGEAVVYVQAATFGRRLKAIAVVCTRLFNSPSTRKDILDPTFLMKPIPLVLLAALSCLSSAFSQDEDAPLGEAAVPTTARVLGALPDGTPPPPEPPKPAFVVAAKDILATQIHEQGGRKIIV